MDPQQLKVVPLLAGLSNRQLRELAQWMDEVDLPAGTKLLEQGTFAYEFVIIESGSASVTIDGQQVNELGPGAFFGEIALLEAPRRTAAVQATSPMRAIVMTGSSFRAMIQEMPQVADRVRAVMDERLNRTDQSP